MKIGEDLLGIVNSEFSLFLFYFFNSKDISFKNKDLTFIKNENIIILKIRKRYR
ncbi:hypothetical protein JMUB3935_2623 [Leptotrichia trevisanii]|uniref:Uncharacterized protein n=1 Tax=Leptotrichia trevisanii TaxID=109328 RepID=A0A510KPF0_9FUSO|nr:hypothetical protein JMUB3935_2623 [Leptotrichia trevisanii]